MSKDRPDHHACDRATQSCGAIVAAIGTWYVAPEDAGQMIEDDCGIERDYGVEYKSGIMVCRRTDYSKVPARVTYQFATALDTFEPWAGAPRARDWSAPVTLGETLDA